MTPPQKELLVARIIAGCLRLKLKTGETLVIKKPPLEQVYVAQELYKEYEQSLIDAGCLTEDEAIQVMLEAGLWSEEKQSTLDIVTKNIEEFKVSLYESMFKSEDKKKIRAALKIAKDTYLKLSRERQCYCFLTTSGAASLLRTRYTIGMSLYHLDGRPYFTEDTFWTSDSSVLDYAVDFYMSNRIEESAFREIARTDPWRSIWNSRKAEGSFFGVPVVEVSDEQRSILIWSGIYDSIYEHPEAPSDVVIEDDDVLDGWMIIQRNKRKQGQMSKIESIVANEDIRNMGEVFIPAQTMADAKEIDKLNDHHSHMVKKQRMAYVRKHGTVPEAWMPDSRQEIQTELNNKFKEGMKNG